MPQSNYYTHWSAAATAPPSRRHTYARRRKRSLLQCHHHRQDVHHTALATTSTPADATHYFTDTATDKTPSRVTINTSTRDTDIANNAHEQHNTNTHIHIYFTSQHIFFYIYTKQHIFFLHLYIYTLTCKTFIQNSVAAAGQKPCSRRWHTIMYLYLFTFIHKHPKYNSRHNPKKVRSRRWHSKIIQKKYVAADGTPSCTCI